MPKQQDYDENGDATHEWRIRTLEREVTDIKSLVWRGVLTLLGNLVAMVTLLGVKLYEHLTAAVK